MLKIRLTRTGRKNAATYRVVIANERSKRDGEFIAYVGTYNPLTKPSTVEFDKEAIKGWLDKGAQPTDTVRRLLVKAGLVAKPKKEEVKVYKVKQGKKAEERAASKAEKK
jgi:small subunit ribosomal protein S16